MHRLFHLALAIAILAATLALTACGKNTITGPSSSETNPNPNPNPTPTPTPNPSGIGGTWRGTLECADGDGFEVAFKFASSGNPIYGFRSQGNPFREVEVSKVGFLIEYVPPGGGVERVIVEKLSVSRGRVEFDLRINFERSGNILDQNATYIASTAVLLSDGTLAWSRTVESQNIASNEIFVVSESASRCKATLTRQ